MIFLCGQGTRRGEAVPADERFCRGGNGESGDDLGRFAAYAELWPIAVGRAPAIYARSRPCWIDRDDPRSALPYQCHLSSGFARLAGARW